MVIIDDGSGKTHWYLHLKDYTVKSGQQVKRGDIIAHLGDTGTEEFPHLHYEVRNGDNSGPMSLEALRRDGINPNGYIRGRDSGYLFNNPTMYQDTVTGERGVLAEKAPERLLGSNETRRLQNMLSKASVIASNPLSPATNRVLDYANVGANLSSVPTNTIVQEGDSMIYNGVAPDSLMQQWRDDQRRQRVLRGT